jgi:phosphate transport system permease protein
MRVFGDKVMTSVVWAMGVLLLAMVAALVVYLGRESSNAFRQTFPYGFRFAVVAPSAPADLDLGLEPNSTLLATHPDGDDGIDEKEDGILMPAPADLFDSAGATGAAPGGPDGEGHRDDWRDPKPAERGDRFTLYAYAAPGQRETMTLAWQPDASFLPRNSPFDFRLRLVRTPAGIQAPPVDIDLKKRPSGRVDLPAWTPGEGQTGKDGYVFSLEAKPTTSTTAATLAGIVRTDWAPTLQYPRFGFLPLLYGTLLLTFIAVLVATPVSIALAVFTAEVLPAAWQVRFKPVMELLASVPTVVLGYFGLMFVAPGLQGVFSGAIQMESGRTMLTAALVTAILLVPVIATVAEDAVQTVPRHIRDGGDALGLTVGETLRKLVLPAARGGIGGAVLLGVARAVGETMIIWMLGGGTASLPSFADAGRSLIQSTRGVPDTIGIEMANVEFEGSHYGHLFLLGLTLFLITLAVNLLGYRMTRRNV